MDRVGLIEVIDQEKAKLSPAAKELWEKVSLLAQLNPEEVAAHPRPTGGLTLADLGVATRVGVLSAGLYSADARCTEESRGRPTGF